MVIYDISKKEEKVFYFFFKKFEQSGVRCWFKMKGNKIVVLKKYIKREHRKYKWDLKMFEISGESERRRAEENVMREQERTKYFFFPTLLVIYVQFCSHLGSHLIPWEYCYNKSKVREWFHTILDAEKFHNPQRKFQQLKRK